MGSNTESYKIWLTPFFADSIDSEHEHDRRDHLLKLIKPTLLKLDQVSANIHASNYAILKAELTKDRKNLKKILHDIRIQTNRDIKCRIEVLYSNMPLKDHVKLMRIMDKERPTAKSQTFFARKFLKILETIHYGASGRSILTDDKASDTETQEQKVVKSIRWNKSDWELLSRHAKNIKMTPGELVEDICCSTEKSGYNATKLVFKYSLLKSYFVIRHTKKPPSRTWMKVIEYIASRNK